MGRPGGADSISDAEPTRCWRLLVLLGLALGAHPAWPQSAYEVAEDQPIALRALLDLRFVRQGPAPSWLEGGPGKTRYGGVVTDGSFERVTRFAVAQAALQPSAALPYDIRAFAQLNWNVDVAFDGNVGAYNGWPLLIEAGFRKEWSAGDNSWGLQAGVTNAPLSLEHTGPARTPEFSLTPSALNSWLWEEGRVVGFEGEWWRTLPHNIDIDVAAGMGWGPDQMGILLARRGWVLSDFLSGINSTLPIPGTGKDTHELDERDGRPALYGAVNLTDPWQLGKLRLGYYDNLGNLDVTGVWETRFGTAGAALQPLPGLDILVQYLIGSTATRTNAFESNVSAWYPLISYRYRNHRVTARYDQFWVQDIDGAPNTRERGEAVTAAYLFDFWLRHRIAFEYITFVECERPPSASPSPCDDGWQVSYRFRY
jgi:hypothetical protein